jgi:hypothetical protein
MVNSGLVRSVLTRGLLLLSLPVVLSGQPPSSSVRSYAGDWVRFTQVQNFIVYLSITSPAEQQMLVHAWGRCKRKPEEGGTRADCEDWGTAEAKLSAPNTASLFQPVHREWWDINLTDNGARLWVRVRDSDIAWTRDPGIDLIRQSLTPAEPPAQPPAQPPTKPPAQPPAQTCSIYGELSGSLEGLSYPDHPGPATKVRLRHMGLRAPDGKQRNAEVKGRKFTFSNLPAGVVYRIFPAFFRSQPPHRDVTCTANQRHRANFKILGPAPEG